MAEQLYLAVELRCDAKHVQFDTPEGGNKIKFLEMENQEAEQYLRRSSVRNNCEKGAMRFDGNFEMWIIDREKCMPKFKIRQFAPWPSVFNCVFFYCWRTFLRVCCIEGRSFFNRN